MANSIYFATAFYHAEGNSPNIKESTEKFKKYYQCIIVLFATIRRFYKDERLFIFSDKKLPLQYSNLLKAYNIETIILNKNDIFYVNNSFNNKFPGCLFTLDVIDYINNNKNIKDIGKLCLLDSDIVMQNSLQNLSDSGIVINYPTQKDTNGQSINSLTIIYNDYYNSKKKIDDFKYFGGEFYLFSDKLINNISKDLKGLRDFLKLNFNTYGNNFTEEHILSIILNNCKEASVVDSTIKRVWTTDTYTNINGDEEKYSLLHMPAEKDKLFEEIFSLIKNNNTRYLNSFSDKSYKKILLKAIKSREYPSLMRKIIINSKNIINKLKKKY